MNIIMCGVERTMFRYSSRLDCSLHRINVLSDQFQTKLLITLFVFSPAMIEQKAKQFRDVRVRGLVKMINGGF